MNVINIGKRSFRFKRKSSSSRDFNLTTLKISSFRNERVFIELNNSEWHNHAQEKVSGTARVKILWESQHRD